MVTGVGFSPEGGRHLKPMSFFQVLVYLGFACLKKRGLLQSRWVDTHRPGLEAQYRRPAIPWRVALPQSPPPLRRVILLYSRLRPFQAFRCAPGRQARFQVAENYFGFSLFLLGSYPL
jgi:hypothetical protein